MRRTAFARIGRAVVAMAVAVGAAQAGGAARAQDLMRIAAVVNDQVISVYDLRSRMAMALLSSNLPDTPEIRQQIVGPVLRNLIDEALQVQEAKRQGITVPEEQLVAALDEIARNNGLTPGEFPAYLAKHGIGIGAVESQVYAQIAWGKFVNQRLRPTVDVGEDEIDAELARLEATQGQPEYLVSIIDLYLDAQTSEQQLLETADGLVAQLRDGANFAAIAQQFSQGSMASDGGDLGWIREGQSRPQIDQVLREMEVGAVSDPIRSLDGVHILQLRDKRTVMAPDDSEVEVYLSQILLPGEADEGAEAKPARLARAGEIRVGLSGCEAMAERAAGLETSLSGDIGWLKLSDLPPEFRSTVAALAVGQPSEPVVTDAGVHLLMVCERRDPADEQDIRDVIYDRLVAQRLAILERRLLRDLRRTAFVDLRI